MSLRLFVIRHAESTWSATGLLQGQADPPLSARGVQQAAALAVALHRRPLTAVISSPLCRARQTAEAIAGAHDLPLRVDGAFKEVSLGKWEGQPRSEVGGVDAALACLGRQDEGESLEKARARVAPALAALLAAYPDATLALVTHSIIGRVILAQVLGAGITLVPHLKLKLASISLIRLEAHGAVLESLSDVQHLGQAVAAGRVMEGVRR